MKQERYTDNKGEDWIDEFARTHTQEQFIAAMKFNMGKYIRRLGKKDDMIKELTKIADYANRTIDYLKKNNTQLSEAQNPKSYEGLIVLPEGWSLSEEKGRYFLNKSKPDVVCFTGYDLDECIARVMEYEEKQNESK